MSRVFTDENLLNWEAYASSGKFGMPDRPKLLFHCVSDPGQRARYIQLEGDNAQAEQSVHEMPVERLLELLRVARPID